MNNQSRKSSGGPRRYRGGFALVAIASTAVAILTASCAGLDEPVVLATPDTDANAPPQFIPQQDAGDGGDARLVEALRCIGTECPVPYATCASSDPSARPPFKCQHNLLTENENCGSCGNQCPSYPEFGMFGHCSNGACEPQCEGHRRDCNNLPDDGCETFVGFDPKNCGACGNVCPAGERCIDGVCGCLSGKKDCYGMCTDTSSDISNCGACGNFCVDPEDAGPPPPNMAYGCSKSQCGKLICVASWRNCNGTLDDGCEVDVEREIAPGLLDPGNCGGCGVACAPDQECRRLAGGVIVCGCKGSQTFCGSPGNYSCVDTSTDPKHCGLCNHACPFVDLRNQHQVASCIKGVCGTECEPGWGDCNGNPADGCETNLSYDGANCGACGNRCSTGVGQPCVDGRCLTVECDGGDPVTR
jgi:hypothetical protein